MTPYLTCDAAAEMLEPFVDGELPVAEQVSVESHLRWCRVCEARVADMQFFLAIGEPAEPDLRALKVCQHSDRMTSACCRVPDAAEVSLMIGIVAMTHVEPGDIHSCGDHLRQTLRGRGSWPERAHNLGSTHELTLAKLSGRWETSQAVVYHVLIRSKAC